MDLGKVLIASTKN